VINYTIVSFNLHSVLKQNIISCFIDLKNQMVILRLYGDVDIDVT